MNKRDPKLARWAGLLCIVVLLLLAGCRNRARLATEASEPTPPALAPVEPTIPPTPLAQVDAFADSAGNVSSAEVDLGLFVNWFALISVLLLFLGIVGGTAYLFGVGVGRVLMRRHSHLFTFMRRNTQ